MNVAPRLHALTFTVWAFGAAVCVHAAPNAVYLTVVLLAAILVVQVHGRDGALARSFPTLVAFAAVFAVIRVVLTVLTTHGIDDALVTVPVEFTTPDWLGGFTVGGTIEEPVLLRALGEAYPFVVFVSVFAAWSAVVSHAELLRYVPRVFHELGLAVTVAVVFVPTTIRTLRTVREAELARTGGVRARGRWRRMLIPVLETGLERAIALSESMDARGYGHRPTTTAETVTGWFVLAGVGALGGSFFALVSQAEAAAVGLLAAALTGMVAATVVASRSIARTRYRPRRITGLDWAIAGLCLVGPLAIGALSIRGDSSLAWSPESFAAPPVNLVVVAALTSLIAPVVAWPKPAVVDLPAEEAAPSEVVWAR